VVRKGISKKVKRELNQRSKRKTRCEALEVVSLIFSLFMEEKNHMAKTKAEKIADIKLEITQLENQRKS
jgi:hypothetical protein